MLKKIIKQHPLKKKKNQETRQQNPENTKIKLTDFTQGFILDTKFRQAKH